MSVDQDAEGCARSFVRGLGLKHAVVAFAEGQGDMPKFPVKLGCMGFVVLDAHLRFVTTKTEPSLSSGGYAGLEAAEAMLRGAAARAVTVAGLPEGDFAVEFVGVSGVPEGHVAVRLPGGEVATFHEDALSRAALPPPLAASPAGAGGPPGAMGCVGGMCAKPVCCAGGAGAGGSSVPPSVGHADMDAEHAALAAAFRNADTPAALRSAVELLDEHFEHEEELMRRAGFGASVAPGAPSAFEGHAADHSRIRDLAADTVLKTYCERHDSGADPREAAAALLAAVAQHTAAYDTLYEQAVAKSSSSSRSRSHSRSRSRSRSRRRRRRRKNHHHLCRSALPRTRRPRRRRRGRLRPVAAPAHAGSSPVRVTR